MAHFPVSSSNLSASHLGSFVEEKYSINVLACKLIRSGINDPYIVDSDDEKFVFSRVQS